MHQLNNNEIAALNDYKPELGQANKYRIDPEGYYCLYNQEDKLIAIISFVLFKSITQG